MRSKGKIVCILMCCFVLTACSQNDSENGLIQFEEVSTDSVVKPTTSVIAERLKEDDLMEAFKQYYPNMSILEIAITDKEQLTNSENIFCKVYMDNEHVYIDQVFIVVAEYYDGEGWKVENIYTIEELQYNIKCPEFEKHAGERYEIVSVNYEENATSCIVRYKERFNYQMGTVIKTIKKTFHFNERMKEWSINLEYVDSEVVDEDIELNKEYLTGKWSYKGESVEIKCYGENRIDVKSIELSGEEFFDWKTIRGKGLSENMTWVGWKIKFFWDLGDFEYTFTSGHPFEGNKYTMSIILSPELENNVLRMYHGSTVTPLSKND